MKIAIDGFTLGLKEGTGLATYAYELAQTLGAGGHEVSVLYGLDGIGRDPRLLWPRFIQALGTRGEMLPADRLKWAAYAAAYALPGLAGWPLAATPIPRQAGVSANGATARLPALAAVCNLPGIYPSAYTLAALTGRAPVLRRPPGVQIFHRTSPLPLRMRGAANVVTVHDIIPLALPHSTVINLKHYRRSMEAALRGADAIFVISEHARRDLLAFFDVPAERVVLTYQAVSVPPALRSIDADELRRQLKAHFGLSPGGYFLFYGAIEPKKNVMRILDAHAAAKTDLPLVIAGRNGWLYEQEVRRIRRLLREPNSSGGIRRYEYLPFQQLMVLLRGARALVFPSLYEGFGLPVLEAMLMGVPVITSNAASLPEVAGDAALLVDPCDTAQLARAMERLAGDDALCASLVEKGSEQVKRFSAEKHLQRLEAGYRLALG